MTESNVIQNDCQSKPLDYIQLRNKERREAWAKRYYALPRHRWLSRDFAVFQRVRVIPLSVIGWWLLGFLCTAYIAGHVVAWVMRS